MVRSSFIEISVNILTAFERLVSAKFGYDLAFKGEASRWFSSTQRWRQFDVPISGAAIT